MFRRRSVVDPPDVAPPTSGADHLLSRQKRTPTIQPVRQPPGPLASTSRLVQRLDRNPPRRGGPETRVGHLERAWTP